MVEGRQKGIAMQTIAGDRDAASTLALFRAIHATDLGPDVDLAGILQEASAGPDEFARTAALSSLVRDALSD